MEKDKRIRREKERKEKHPLNQRSFYSSVSFEEWKQKLSVAKDAWELKGLLHEGYIILGLSPKEEIERFLIYISYADGYRRNVILCDSPFCLKCSIHNMYDDCFFHLASAKKEIARKAWDMLGQNFFKRFSQQEEIKRIVKSKDIMKEIVRFFSWEDNIPHIECGKKYNHNDKIAYDFLLKLCKLGWDGNNCEHYIKWKPFFIRILIRLGRLDLLEEVIFSEITKEDIDIIRENLNINPSFLGGSKNSFKTMLLLEYRLKEEEEREK